MAIGPSMNSADKDRPSDDLPEESSPSGEEPGSPQPAPDAANEADFVPWEETSFDEVNPSTVGHRKIIKSRLVEEKDRRKIVPELPAASTPPQGKAEIEPLLDNGEIVGVRVACSCGAVHEARFEFSS